MENEQSLVGDHAQSKKDVQSEGKKIREDFEKEIFVTECAIDG